MLIGDDNLFSSKSCKSDVCLLTLNGTYLKIDALALYFFGQNIKIYIDNDSPSQGYAKLSSLQTEDPLNAI